MLGEAAAQAGMLLAVLQLAVLAVLAVVVPVVRNWEAEVAQQAPQIAVAAAVDNILSVELLAQVAPVLSSCVIPIISQSQTPVAVLHLLPQRLVLIKLQPLLPAPATYLSRNYNGTLRIPGSKQYCHRGNCW
jgi:hypothetical protein